MTTLNGEHLPPIVAAPPAAGTRFRVPGRVGEAFRDRGRRLFAIAAGAAAAGTVVGFVALFTTAADGIVLALCLALAIAMVAATVDDRRRTGSADRGDVVAAIVCAVAALVLFRLPHWIYGWQFNAVIDRTVIGAPLLLVLSALVASRSIRRLLGNTPGARDLALYPWLALPVGLALIGWGLLLGNVIVQGLPGLTPNILFSAWHQTVNGFDIGLLNHILGTILLIILTILFSIVPGVGAGILLAEYPGRIATLVGFCTAVLRAMSVFIIGVVAASLVSALAGTDATSPLSILIRGFYISDIGSVEALNGSFILGGLALSILVIPIITRLTQEGLASVPVDLREGAVALAATEGYRLRRILLPWAAPNILTGVLLGAAEAAGSVAVILFIAGNGDHGVTPFSQVTSLDYALFATRFGWASFIDTMGYRAHTDYAFTAALLLLLLTLGLTVAGIWLRGRATRRYRGTLTAH